jgi:hypothetical protein
VQGGGKRSTIQVGGMQILGDGRPSFIRFNPRKQNGASGGVGRSVGEGETERRDGTSSGESLIVSERMWRCGGRA